jgi:hypothetical protein
VKFPLAKSVELSAKMSNENNSHLASGMCEREILAEVYCFGLSPFSFPLFFLLLSLKGCKGFVFT